MNIAEWQDWIQGLVVELSQDFGVSDFFSTPDEAAAWVETNVIDPNPRLTEQEKEILLFNSNEARVYANEQVLTTFTSPREGAVLYWEAMGLYIATNTNDEKLINLFNVAIDAAESATVEGQEKNLPRTPLKIPWWILAGIGYLIFKGVPR
jgi:hypothetical protein